MTVFAAIADDTRRSILDLLVERGGGTATALAAEVGVTRQAAAKHLAILADAGLASSSKVGRETRFIPTPTGLGPVEAWVASTTAAWDRRLAALADHLET